MEIVPNSNFAHRARSSQINMLCVITKYRLCEFHLNALAGQKAEFCDSVTLGHLHINSQYKIVQKSICRALTKTKLK